jgi:hypothetical protein
LRNRRRRIEPSLDPRRREQGERFVAEHVQPLIDQGPSAFPDPDNFTEPTRDGYYELHDVVT